MFLFCFEANVHIQSITKALVNIVNTIICYGRKCNNSALIVFIRTDKSIYVSMLNSLIYHKQFLCIQKWRKFLSIKIHWKMETIVLKTQQPMEFKSIYSFRNRYWYSNFHLVGVSFIDMIYVLLSVKIYMYFYLWLLVLEFNYRKPSSEKVSHTVCTISWTRKRMGSE